MIHFKKHYIGVEMERNDIWTLATMLSELMIRRTKEEKIPAWKTF